MKIEINECDTFLTENASKSSLKNQTDDLENKISFKNVRLLGGLESKLNEDTVFPYFAV